MTDDTHTPEPAEKRQFGEDIAFGMQQTLACWATDFIDPWVGEKIQHRFEDEKHHAPRGSTWYGEVVGDSAAFFAFLGIQRYIPGVTAGLKHLTRNLFGGMLERTGKRHLRHEHIAEQSPEYAHELEVWKEFQSDNIAKSAIISVSSIVANVATQKALGNTHKLAVITLAKLAGASITVAGMLGLRFAVPKTTRQFDEELNEQYFSPLIRKTQKLFGGEVDPKPEHRHHHHHNADGLRKSHVKTIGQRRDTASVLDTIVR